MTLPPANWYPDPSGPPAQLRYWDGSAWTDNVVPPAPAPPPRPVPTTPDGVPLAGWWWRVLAHLIDGMIVATVSGIVGWLVQGAFRQDFQELVEGFAAGMTISPETVDYRGFFADVQALFAAHAVAVYGPALVIGITYVALMLRFVGATLGKLAVGLRVRLREKPGQLSWTSIAARLVITTLPTIVMCAGILSRSLTVLLVFYAIGSLFSMLDPLWAAWDSRRQAIHDKVARTNVVTIR